MFLNRKLHAAVSYVSLLLRNSVTGIFRDTPLLAQATLTGIWDVACMA